MKKVETAGAGKCAGVKQGAGTEAGIKRDALMEWGKGIQIWRKGEGISRMFWLRASVIGQILRELAMGGLNFPTTGKCTQGRCFEETHDEPQWWGTGEELLKCEKQGCQKALPLEGNLHRHKKSTTGWELEYKFDFKE